MSEQHQTNGSTERPATPEELEKLEIRARYKQEITKIEAEAATELARIDAERTKRMPVALRMFFDDRLYERAAVIAERMAEARGFTPDHLIGQKGACFAVVSKALAWNLDPFSVAQSTYQVGGRVAYEGRLVQAIMEASGRLKGGIKARYIGDWSKVEGRFRVDDRKPVKTWKDEDEEGLGIVLTAQLIGEDEPREFTFYLKQCWPRNASTWPTRPKQQLHYNAIRAFASVVAPSLLLGVPFQDDFDDQPPMKDITPPAPPPVDLKAEGIRGGGAMHDVVETDATETVVAAAEEKPAEAPQQQGGQGEGDKIVYRIAGKEYVQPGRVVKLIEAMVADCETEDELDAFGDPDTEVGGQVAILPDGLRDVIAQRVQDRRQEIAEAEAAKDRGQAAQSAPVQQAQQPAGAALFPTE